MEKQKKGENTESKELPSLILHWSYCQSRNHFRLSSLFLFCVILFFINSCSSSEAGDTSDISKSNPPYSICGIDGSGSYNFHEASKEKIQSLINHLPAGATISIRWITTDSYLPSNSILTETLPTVDTDQDINVFNKKQKILKIVEGKRLQEARDELVSQVNQTQRPKSEYTDIFGFLVVCAERMIGSRDRDFHIVICTDLKNNVDKYHKFINEKSLDGAMVHILAYEHTDPQSRIVWTEQFLSWGAKQVRYYAPDEELPNIFHEMPKQKGTNTIEPKGGLN